MLPRQSSRKRLTLGKYTYMIAVSEKNNGAASFHYYATCGITDSKRTKKVVVILSNIAKLKYTVIASSGKAPVAKPLVPL